MKKMKKLIALVIVFLMAFSTMAYGATYSNITITPGGVTDSRTLNFNITGAAAGHQVTMIVTPQGQTAITDATVKYINQNTASGSTFTHSFTLGNNVGPGTYLLRIGGTGISTPENFLLIVEGDADIIITPPDHPGYVPGYATIIVPETFDAATQHVTVQGQPAFFSPVRNKFISLVADADPSDVVIANGAVDPNNIVNYGVVVTGGSIPQIGDIMSILGFYNAQLTVDFSPKQRLAADVRGEGFLRFDILNDIMTKIVDNSRIFRIEEN